jgi:dihydroorotase-like cyclic amidohydrolase
VAGLGASKGGIAPGADADLGVFAPGEPFTVDPGTLHHRNPSPPAPGAPYAGRYPPPVGAARRSPWTPSRAAGC